MNLRWRAALAATMMVLLAACGGGTDRTKAQVRLVNASSGYAQLDLRVDDKTVQSGVTYGNSASYVEAEPSKSSAIFASNGATALLSFTPSTSERKYYTVLAYGPAGSLKQVTLDENQSEPDANRSLLRVVNAAPDAGSVDVYVTGSNDTLQASVPVQSAVAVDSVGSFITINSGTWRLRITGTGSKTDLRLDVPSFTLGSKGIVTLVITPSAGGVLTRALFLSQQGGITGFAATQARVRAASGLTGTSARLGDVDLLVAGNAPTVSTYSSLSAGDQTLVVTVDGAPLSSTVKTLVAGSDYTLLLHGTAGSPQVSWIDDDNTRPTDIAQAKVRLLNGVSGLSGTATMTVNGAQIGAGVAAGAASGYSLQEASTTADILVAGAGPVTLFSAADQTFLAASSYTVFVLGPSNSATGILRKDR
jgi:Domain of unknown function (DUF4397)